jgi:TetR/AcrR family transcriptional regulator
MNENQTSAGEAMTLPSPEMIPLEPQAKQRLLDAAGRLFLEKGYAATSVHEIVAAAGVTKPTLYYYFTNKEAIYLAIIQQAAIRFHTVLSEHAEPEGPALEHLLELAGHIYDLFIKEINAARLIYAKAYGAPLGTPAFDMTAVESSFIGVFRGIVQRGIDRGEFQGNVDDIVLAAGSIIDSCLMSEISSACLVRPNREGMQRYLRILYEGFRMREG